MASRIGNKITGYEINREESEGPLRMPNNNAKPIDPKVLDAMFRFIESEGQILGEEVIRVMTWTRKTASDVRIQGLQTTVTCPGRKRTNGDNMDPNTREGIAGTYVDTPPVGIQIGVLAIGAVGLVSINGEVYSLIGQKVKDSAPLKNTVIVTSANGRGPGLHSERRRLRPRDFPGAERDAEAGLRRNYDREHDRGPRSAVFEQAIGSGTGWVARRFGAARRSSLSE